MKPILFNTEMVRAIIDGRKTQARQVIKPQPTNPRINNMGWLDWDDGHGYGYVLKPKYQSGDILYVRETWCPKYFDDYSPAYKADYYKNRIGGEVPEPKWKPSIHMPKEAARIFLKVTDVRVERLQDITEDNAKAEGVEPTTTPNIQGKGITHIQGFGELWNSTVKKSDLGKYSWNANPWVWVYEFERVEKPAPLDNSLEV